MSHLANRAKYVEPLLFSPSSNPVVQVQTAGDQTDQVHSGHWRSSQPPASLGQHAAGRDAASQHQPGDLGHQHGHQATPVHPHPRRDFHGVEERLPAGGSPLLRGHPDIQHLLFELRGEREPGGEVQEN